MSDDMNRATGGGLPDGGMRRAAASYRRGIVLGLTMAELMLLLVFCLALISAVIFTRDARTISRIEAELAEARLKVAELDAEGSMMARMLEARPDVPEDWRELSIGAATARQLAETGMTLPEVQEIAPYWRDLAPYVRAGTTPEELARLIDEARALDDARAEQDLVGMTPDEIARLAAGARTAETAPKTDAAPGMLDRLLGRGTHDWPPIISLSEADGYSFGIGSAEISPEFRTLLSTAVVEQLVQISGRYGTDVIEVIGHTDEQGMGGRQSNLDRSLLPVLRGTEGAGRLRPGDNAGLGMARAAAVARILRADPRLSELRILPYSGAQTIMPGDVLADGSQSGDVKERRRIEIRVRRSPQAG
jgi:outer membrane protein OmpA-like peptidoglycan-associated protein